MVLNKDFSELFPDLPKELVQRLEKSYSEILINYLEHRFEPSELNGGKFSECVYRILEHTINSDDSYTPIGKPIFNFEKSCRKFENKSDFPETIRFHIPKLLVSLYTLRNKRGVGHLATDVNPNFMDSKLVVNITKWILSDLIRVFHNLKPNEAQNIVDTINIKDMPIVWESDDIKRVLDTTLKTTEQVLVLLYSEYPNKVKVDDLINWIEYSNHSVFRNNILQSQHNNRLIEYNTKSKTAKITTKGISLVENKIDLHSNFDNTNL